ncbi:hypothetical protein JCM8202v2_005806 [Rhodotorula sphaerocarpa]
MSPHEEFVDARPVSLFPVGDDGEPVRLGGRNAALHRSELRFSFEGEEVAGEISPQDRHYLNRMLVNLELQREMSALSQIGTLAKYGPPFAPHANGPNSRPTATTPGAEGKRPPLAPAKSSFLGGIFGGGGGSGGSGGSKDKKDAQFEGYRWSPADVEDSPIYQYLFWRFIYNMPALDSAKPEYWQEQIQPFFDSFAERDLSSTVERGEITKRRMLSLGIVRIIGTYYSTCVRPLQPSAPARPSSSMRVKVDLTVPGDMETVWRVVCPDASAEVRSKIWVAVTEEKGRGLEVTYRFVTRAGPAPAGPVFATTRSFTDCRSLASALTDLDPKNRLDLPPFPTGGSAKAPSCAAMRRYIRVLVVSLACPLPPSGGDAAVAGQQQLLERAREEVEAFLMRDGVTTESPGLVALLSKCEAEDRAAEARHQRWVQVGQRAQKLQEAWRTYRHKLIDEGELDRTMDFARRYSKTTELPIEYQEAVQWASIWFGQALHWIFVGAATGPEVFNILRSFHELIPYGPVKVGLGLVNPTLAIKAIVSLILGQPAGQLSLFQRIWSHVCNSANKHQRKLIERFRKRIRNDALCNALKAHVRAGYVQRQRTKQEAVRRKEDIVLTIVRERGSKGDYDLVQRWHAEFMRAEANPHGSTGAKQFGDLKELLAAYYRYRDREQVLQIALEPNTPRLLHASISVFYGAIHTVAKISDLPARVADTQAFLDDLCRVCLSDNPEPSEFIKLANRHYEKAYYFLYELASKGGSNLDPMLDWARSGLTFIREGIPEDPTAAAAGPASRGARASPDVDALLSAPDVPEAEREALLAEARRMADWTVLKKARSEVFLRVDLLRADDVTEDDSWLDRTELWQSFLSQWSAAEQARFAAAANEQAHELRRTGPGGDLEWAWWAGRETAGAAGKAGVVKAHQESAADSVRESGGGGDSSSRKGSPAPSVRSPSLLRRKSSREAAGGAGSGGGGGRRRSGESIRRFSLDASSRRSSEFGANAGGGGGGGGSGSGTGSRRPSLELRTSSSTTAAAAAVGAAGTDAAGEDLAGRMAVPPIEVEATRSVLGRYLEQVKGYLGAARKHQVR